jgi:hypothetical protein
MTPVIDGQPGCIRGFLSLGFDLLMNLVTLVGAEDQCPLLGAKILFILLHVLDLDGNNPDTLWPANGILSTEPNLVTTPIALT